MTVNWIPCSAKKPKAWVGTAVSPVAQLFPENRGMSLPKAFRSLSWSGKRMRICMALN